MVSLDVNDPRSGDDRRQSQADGSLPYWARIILAVGVFPSLTVYLVWLISTNFMTAQAEGNKMLQEHVITAPAIIKMLENHEKSDLRLEAYLRLVCVQAAKTKMEQNACLSVR